jgi:translocation and assembly module TamB
MNTPQTPEQSPAAAKLVHRPRWAASLIVVLVPALLALALAAGAAGWIYATTSGLRAVVAVAGALLSPRISAHGLQGSLRSGFSAESFAIDARGWTVRATAVQIEPRELRWAGRSIDLERVVAQTVTIEWVASDAPASPLTSLALPVDLRLRAVSISTLQAGARGTQATTINGISFGGRMNGEAAAIERGEFQLGPARVAIAGRIDARPPFALQADSKIVSSLHEHDLGAQVRASGSLQEVQLEIDADSDATRIKARAALTPFAPVPLARLTADVAGFDPALWFEGVPTMRLRGNADLKPVADSAQFSVSGPFAVSNDAPGPIDQQRLPVRSARGMLTWSMSRLVLAVERLEGVRGTASGAFSWSAQDGLDASARLAGVDASTIHTSLVPTSVEGSLTYRLIDATHRFVGGLRNVRGVLLAADIDLSLRDEIVAIDSARLRLAGGKAEVSGRVELRDRQSLGIKGSFVDLDLAQLVKGIDTRLTGRVDIDGSLRPALAGKALIELADSQILGRPLAGRATVQLAPQRFDADIDARSGPARLTAQGGLGGGKELTFELIAPQLVELLPRYAGRIEARGTVRGEYSAPTLQMDAVATRLKLPGGQVVQHIDASMAGGLAPDATLAVMAKLTGHSSPSGADTSIAGATLVGRGTTADHTFELNATSVSQQPMRAIASGGWRDGAWRGSLVAAETGRPLELRLRTPAALVVGPETVSFGPADFEMRAAKFTAVELRRQEARWRFAGNFDDLQPQTLDAQARAPRRVVRSGAGDRTPLTMRGHWELDFADSLSGVAVIERTGGDLYGGIDAQDPIGINGMGAALSFLDNRVTGTVYVRGQALGRLDAIIDAHVDTAGGLRLAQDRPFRIDIDSVLPDLGWIGPLIGDSVQFGGSGTIRATVSGTPGDPTASGDIRAESMRLAWVEQGVRLENGKLDAKLEEGVLVINELVFTGTPRVMPDDKRAFGAISLETPGHLSAVGRIALRSLTGSVGVKADRLPVLQRRDRWMVVSGDGGITLTPAHAELYAKVQVDGAYIDFSRLRGPRTLPGDVVVVRAEQPRRAVAPPPVDVVLAVEGRLGRRFYIRGAGLEARLAGQVEVTGRPSQLRAAGSVRTLDGIYTGYGQRLQIERGIVTFQGPLENPALNVLAVRTGLPVEVGVAIGGTALKPVVRLHSDPAMSDIERLNWLVLGRPPGGSGDGFAQERAMLTAAASALFAGQSDSSSANLMRSLGIDEISLRPGQDSSSLLPRGTVAGSLRSSSGTTAASDFVAIGKRINEDLYLTFEQALSGAAYYVALNYQLTRRLSLIARAGSTNALDLVYSIAFD